jgi:hypothetical protein
VEWYREMAERFCREGSLGSMIEASIDYFLSVTAPCGNKESLRPVVVGKRVRLGKVRRR